MHITKAVLAGLLLCSVLSASADEEAEPTPELLEFIGIWSTGQGEWFDPSQLEGWELKGDEQGGEEEDDA